MRLASERYRGFEIRFSKGKPWEKYINIHNQRKLATVGCVMKGGKIWHMSIASKKSVALKDCKEAIDWMILHEDKRIG
jgi:hypothetical protein